MPAKTTAATSQATSDLQRKLDGLTIDLRSLRADYEGALRREAAMAEILQVTNSSGGNLAPVFDAILEKAMALCGAAFGFLTTYDGEHFMAAALRGVPPALASYFAAGM